jgi:hypothetical protein
MSSPEPEHATALIHLDWRISPGRVESMRSRPVFACNARFPDRQPADLFSVVLRWPSADPTEAHFSLLVQAPSMRPVGARLQPGQRISVTEGIRVLAEAEVIRLLE